MNSSFSLSGQNTAVAVIWGEGNPFWGLLEGKIQEKIQERQEYLLAALNYNPLGKDRQNVRPISVLYFTS